jgi:hypothetical protein
MVLVSAKPVEPKLTLTGGVEEVRIDTGIGTAVQRKSRLNDATWNKPV